MRYHTLLRAPFAYLVNGARAVLVYRINFWLQIIGLVIMIGVQVFLWRAIAQEARPAFTPDDLTHLVIYTTLSRLLLFVLPNNGPVDFISTRLRSGALLVDLLRPVHLMSITLATEIGRGGVRLLAQVIPAGILAALIFDIGGWSIQPLPLALGSLLLSYIIAFQIGYLTGLLSLWTGNIWGVAEMRDALLVILGGSFIPLHLYPAWLRTLAQFFPFQSIYYTPLAIYTELPLAPATLALQGFWAVALTFLGLWLTSRLVRRMVVHGG